MEKEKKMMALFILAGKYKMSQYTQIKKQTKKNMFPK